MKWIASDASRRSFLRSVSGGFGALAYAALTARPAGAAPENPLAPRNLHFAAKAKRVLFLCMEGAPSHVDTFDHKPELAKRDGQPIGKGRVPTAKLMASPWKFARRGQSGLWISELFPELARQADKLCLINSMKTDVPAHPPAFIQMHTGISTSPRPSMGAWVLYGLGTGNANLPGYVTISPHLGNGGPRNFGSAFLPAALQATPIGSSRRPIANARIANLKNPLRSADDQEAQLDFLRTLDSAARKTDPGNPFLDGLKASHELAYRMQGELPPVIDLEKEASTTKSRYGIGERTTDNFGRQCLMARRLLEAGVRFVEVCHGGWDQHRNLEADHGRHARAVDRPIAGLLADLDARGMLADTLVIWGGEFGRTPYGQTDDGRDHNHQGYTTWFAGGGVKAGHVHGATDEFGMEAVESPVHVHDWHATILHLLGLDHKRLTFRHAGREMRLTDTKGNVVEAIVA